MQFTCCTIKLLYNLWRQISPIRRSQFGYLLVLIITTSFAEIFSLGAVLPFLAALIDPQKVFEYPSLQFIIQKLGITSGEELIKPITLFFVSAILISGTMRLLLLWVTTRLATATGAELSLGIYQRTLYQPYKIHTNRNSSEIINGIWNKSSETTTIINMTLNLIASIFLLIAILFVLLTVSPTIALLSFGGVALLYALILRKTRGQLLINSQCISVESTRVLKTLQEGLACIRDVLIDGSQKTYCQIYKNADWPLRLAYANSSFIGAFPRYAVEAICTLSIVGLAYTLSQQNGGITSVIAILGTIAYSTQRILPVLQQGYGAWTYIQAGRASLHDVLDLLNQPLPEYARQPISNVKPLPFQNEIALKDVSFRYDEQTSWVLRNLNLNIIKGSKIGIIGTTGCGKSTLLDVVMGLLDPTEGAIEIDGQSINEDNLRGWQAHIAHVPQTIFLVDSSIEANIAFGVPKEKIDHCRIRMAARQAQIEGVIENLPDKYQTLVGERGARLSGGQRQRIGIARALYKNADVIIFDEATSSLDNETEKTLAEAIDNLSDKITIIIVAHRLTTLSKCTQIAELKEGRIIRTGSYKDIVAHRI